MRTQRPARAVSDFRYSPLVAALAVALAPQAALATTKTVTYSGPDSSDPTPAGSLREALEFFAVPSNCTGADTINFAFSNGPFIVDVSEALPIITCSGLTIDGAGTTAGDRATLAGNTSNSYALRAETGAPVTVRNLVISDFSYGTGLLGNFNSFDNAITNNGQQQSTGINTEQYSGLSVKGNTVSGHIVGIRVDGQPLDPLIHNVDISGANQVYSNVTGIYISYGGSTVSIDGNAITGNTREGPNDGVGIYLENSRAKVNNNLISGNDRPIYIEADSGSQITLNRIGSTDDGMAPMSNNFGIVFGSSFGTLSKDTVITGNVISANRDVAIDLSNFSNITIESNHIGTSIDDTVAMGNNSGGIIAYCGSGIRVASNVVSSNNGPGLEFEAVQGGGMANIVANKIGVMGDGVTAHGNSSYGVALYSASCNDGPSVGTNDLLIRDNIIANNTEDGLLVSEGTGNKIVQNQIYGNGGKNLNLAAPGGPRGNDGGDLDGGANNGQNFPDIASVARDWPGARTVVNFTLDTVPGLYRIDIYSNGTSGTPGGTLKHGFVMFSAGSGPTAGSLSIPGLAVGNEPNNISLTASGPYSSAGDAGDDAVRRDTSEFSSPTGFVTAAPAVTVMPSPPNLDFGTVGVGSTSAPQSITLISSGNEPYQISRMRLGSCFGPAIYGGPFMIASTCVPGHDYPPAGAGDRCAITGRFAPLSLGTQTVTIAVCDNTNIDGARFFTMTGTGGTPPPVAIAPSEFDFGSVLAGSKSEPQQFVISNPSGTSVSIGAVTVSSFDFSVDSSTCGAAIPGGSFCTAQVTFRPSQPQRSDATLSVAATTGSGPSSTPALKIRKSDTSSATAHLTGQGILKSDITLPPSIDFGAYTVGTPPVRQNVQITNTGNTIVSFNNISVTGPFVLTNGCPLNLAPGEQCTIALDFSATTVGDFTGTLSVVSNAAGGTRTIPLTAHAVAVPSAQLSVSPNSVSFGDRLLGTTSATQRVTIKNVGNLPATITSITASADFVVSNNTCTLPLAPTLTCFADVALRPVGFGPRTGSLFVNSDVAGSPNVVSLSGTGCRPFSSSSSRFGVGSGFNCAP